MSIEEAELILNEAVISEPSIKSYTYISAEEISQAINKLLEERLKEQKRISELENKIIEERKRFENIIKEKELKMRRYMPQVYGNIYLDKAM